MVEWSEEMSNIRDLRKKELNLVKEKLSVDNAATVFGTDDRYRVRKEQSDLIKELFDLTSTDEQKLTRGQKQEKRQAVREQIRAKINLKNEVKIILKII